MMEELLAEHVKITVFRLPAGSNFTTGDPVPEGFFSTKGKTAAKKIRF